MFLEDISGGKQVIRAAAICFTVEGQKNAETIPEIEIYRYGRDFSETRKLAEHIFKGSQPLSAVIFFSSTGIAVRLTAPYIVDKTVDPAVIVVNDTADYVIPVLSGHAGRANELSVKLAQLLGAIPVITTASDHRNGMESPDLWAAREGYTINSRNDVKKVTAAILAGGKTEKIRSGERIIWRVTGGTSVSESDDSVVAAVMTPQKYIIGLGCRKGTSPEILDRFVEDRLNVLGIRMEQVYKFCSIDLKKDEPALLDFTRKRNKPFVVFSAQQLNRLSGKFSASEFVARTTGTDNVCERSAIAGCAPWEGKLILRKTAEEGMTIAIAERIL